MTDRIDTPEGDDEAHLVDIVDQLSAVLPGFAARIRVGEVTPELYIQYGDMLHAAAIMCWALAPDFGRLAEELFGDKDNDR